MGLAIEEIEGLSFCKAMIVDALDETKAELELEAKASLFDEKYLPALKDAWLTNSYGDEFATPEDQLYSINHNIVNDMPRVIAHITGAMSVQNPAEKRPLEEKRAEAKVEPKTEGERTARAVNVTLKPRKLKSHTPAKKAAEPEPKPAPEVKPKPVIKVAKPPRDKVTTKPELAELKRIIEMLPKDLQEAYGKIAKYKTQDKIPIGLRPDALTISNIRAVFKDITKTHAKREAAEKAAAEKLFISEFIAVENRAAFKFAIGIDALEKEKRFFYAGDENKESEKADKYNQMLDFPALRAALKTRLTNSKAVEFLTKHLQDEKFSSTFFYLPSKEKEWEAIADFVESENFERVEEILTKAPKLRASIVTNPDNLAYLLALKEEQIELIISKRMPEGFLYDPQTKHDRTRFLEFANGLDFSAVSHEQLASFLHLKTDGKIAINTLKKGNPEFLTEALKAGLSVGFLAKLAVAANGKAGVLVESAKQMFADLGGDKKFTSHNDFLPQLALYRDVKTIAPNCEFTLGEKGKLVITHGKKTYEYNSPADYSRVMSEILDREPKKPAETTTAYSTQNDHTIIGGKKYKLEVKLYETTIGNFKITTKVSAPKDSDSAYIQPVCTFESCDLAMKLASDIAKGGVGRS